MFVDMFVGFPQLLGGGVKVFHFTSILRMCWNHQLEGYTRKQVMQMVIQKVMINFGDMFSTCLKHPFWSFLDQNQQERMNVFR